MTDPSYRGTARLHDLSVIGNYGINPETSSRGGHGSNGFIVKEACGYPSELAGPHPRSETYMREHGIVGIQGIDTRALTRHLRDHGAQEGIISTVETDAGVPSSSGRGPCRDSSPRPRERGERGRVPWMERGRVGRRQGYTRPQAARFRVVAFDSGSSAISCAAVFAGCAVEVVPRIAGGGRPRAQPDGIFLSNGPGDPEAVPYLVESVRGLIGKAPIFGICLGNQILAWPRRTDL